MGKDSFLELGLLYNRKMVSGAEMPSHRTKCCRRAPVPQGRRRNGWVDECGEDYWNEEDRGRDSSVATFFQNDILGVVE